jgi:WD40 repeat protein
MKTAALCWNQKLSLAGCLFVAFCGIAGPGNSHGQLKTDETPGTSFAIPTEKDLPGLVKMIGDDGATHWADILKVDQLSDGRYISLGNDGTVRLWNRDGSKSVAYKATALEVTHDGNRFAIVGNGSLYIFESQSDQLIHKFTPGKANEVNQKGNIEIDETGNLVAYSTETAIIVFDLMNKKTICELPFRKFDRPEHKLSESAELRVALSTNSSHLAITSGTVLYTVDIATQQIVFFVDLRKETKRAGLVRQLEFTDGGNRLVFSDAALTLWTIDIAENRIRQQSIDFARRFSCGGFTLTSDRKKLLCVGFGNAHEVDLESGDIYSRRCTFDRTLPPDSLTVSGDRWVYSDRSNSLKCLDTNVGEAQPLKIHWEIRDIQFSSDGKYLVAGCNDGAIRYFDVDTWKETKAIDMRIGPINTCKFSPSGKYIAAGSGENRKTAIVEVDSGLVVAELDSGYFVEDTFAFGPNEEIVVLCPIEKKIEIVAIPTNTPKQPIDVTKAPLAIHQHGGTEFQPALGKNPQFSNDGRWLFTSNNYHSVAVWDYATRKWKCYIGSHEGNWAMYDHRFFISPDQKSIATIGTYTPVRIYDMPDLDNVKNPNSAAKLSLALEDDFGQDACVAFSHDGKQILTSGRQGTIKIWDRDDGALLNTITVGRKGSQIYHIRVSNDDRYFATANGNGTVYVFEMPGSEKLKKSGDR